MATSKRTTVALATDSAPSLHDLSDVGYLAARDCDSAVAIIRAACQLLDGSSSQTGEEIRMLYGALSLVAQAKSVISDLAEELEVLSLPPAAAELRP